MSENLYFRPGVGTVIYNEHGEVLVFKREDLPDVWQFQQGGMEVGETPEDTLWRELREETGLVDTEFDAVLPYPDWTVYAYSPDVLDRMDWKNCLGQVHRWFYLRLQKDTVVDLSKATQAEFCDSKWLDFATFLEEASPMKRAIYTDLYTYFKQQNLLV